MSDDVSTTSGAEGSDHTSRRLDGARDRYEVLFSLALVAWLYTLIAVIGVFAVTGDAVGSRRWLYWWLMSGLVAGALAASASVGHLVVVRLTDVHRGSGSSR